MFYNLAKLICVIFVIGITNNAHAFSYGAKTKASTLKEQSNKVVVTQDITNKDITLKPKTVSPYIWPRITDNFSLKYDNGVPEVKYYIEHYHQWHINTLMQRAEPFLHLILAEIEKENLPTELILLPIIESSFDTFAKSEAGSSGIWQIMLNTGKRFGLTKNHWYDGRYDIMASTRAALKYLKYLNKRFNGDWLLTIAAYNSGEGRVMQAMRAINHQKKISFWNIKLPNQTRDYVPKLLALVDILRHPDKYNIVLPNIENRPQLQELTINAQIDLAYAAKLADMTLSDLKKFNPGHKKWATSPNGPHSLLLPTKHATLLSSRLANWDIKKLATASRKYIIQKGDSLISIAKKFNIELDELKERNNLTHDLIVAGKPLFIPFYPAEGKDKFGLIHVVSKGETLTSICKKYKVEMGRILGLNADLNKNLIKPGQEILIQ